VLAQLEALHPENIRIVVRHFPLLSIHDKASLAGQAAEAAGAQGQFWPMHDLLFERWEEWVELPPVEFKEWLIASGATLELDVERFRTEIEAGTYESVMLDAFEKGAASGLPGTPFIFFNNAWFRLSASLNNFEAITRLTLLQAEMYAAPPAMTLDLEASYVARISLDSGEIVIRLLPEAAPQTVNNFIFLAEEGWFNGNSFHRVIPGSLVESGDPSETGFGSPGYIIPDEIDPARSFDLAGVVAMSSTGPNTNGSQFFISLAPLPNLDGTRTIFGEVLEGLDILQELEAREPVEDLLASPEATILSVTIEVQ
jgi:cyclophilin family peptidyl-prolyl cis-trans isomerase